MGYKVPGEVDLSEMFITDSWVIERYLGDRLFSCGYNTAGQLGDNTIVHKSSPVQTIAGGSNWKQVSSKYFHVSVIKTDGTLWSFGLNGNGQLGDNTGVSKSSPVQVVNAGTNWKQVSCGHLHTTAIKTDGTLWGFGQNAYGQLGDNSNSNNKSSPIQTVTAGSNWKQVSCGLYHTSAIKTDGTLWLWGRNQYGQLGDNSVVHKSSPVQTIAGGSDWKYVASGSYHTLAIKADGTLWSWGYNINGQLGDNTIADKSSPVQVIASDNNWKQITGGWESSAGIKTDGTLWLWGRNQLGQLGDNTIVDKSSPVQTIAGGNNWKQVSCGTYHMAAIKTDGTLWTCGYNVNGQLGDNTVTHKSSPVQTIAGGTSWKQVSCGNKSTSAIVVNNSINGVY